MRSFLVEKLEKNCTIKLSDREARHALRSLRLKEGDRIRLLDGKGKIANAEITSTSECIVEARIIDIESAPLPQTQLIILQGQLKGPKMDWLVEKLTELGVSEIRIINTEFSVAQREKVDRWQRLAESAAKQSGSAKLPEIPAPQNLPEALNWVREIKAIKIMLEPKAEQKLWDLCHENRELPVILAIGPEGGFSQNEKNLLSNEGFRGARISQNILRGESAAIVSAGIVLHSIDF